MMNQIPIIRLSYPTELKLRLLEHVGRHEIINVDQGIRLHYSTLSDPFEYHVAQVAINQALRPLIRDGFIHTRYYRPPGFKGQGKYPRAFWLSEKGYLWLRQSLSESQFEAIDPKYHSKERAELNILHDLRRTEGRMALYQFANANHLAIGQRKTNLFHFIKPDDLFEFTGKKVTRFFMEQERFRKDYQDFYDKFEPYVRHHQTKKFKDEWKFSNYTVLVPMRSEESLKKIITHFAGACDCRDEKLIKLHAKAPYKLASDVLWFTTYDAFIKNPSGQIFFSPLQRSHSLLDIVQ